MAGSTLILEFGDLRDGRNVRLAFPGAADTVQARELE
jgi:hypothetical protein